MLFDEVCFESLLQLEGDGGAKKIIKPFQEHVEVLMNDTKNVDLDTEEDYLAACQENNKL